MAIPRTPKAPKKSVRSDAREMHLAKSRPVSVEIPTSQQPPQTTQSLTQSRQVAASPVPESPTAWRSNAQTRTHTTTSVGKTTCRSSKPPDSRQTKAKCSSPQSIQAETAETRRQACQSQTNPIQRCATATRCASLESP